MTMDILVADNVTAKLLLGVRSSNLSVTDSYAQQSPPSPSAVILSENAVAPPPVKFTTCRIPRRTLLRIKRRTRRRLSGADSGDDGFFFGDGGDGPFGGGSGGFGGSGGGWNFNGFGDGHNWDESLPDPAFDFVYQVLSWIVLSNCLHFSFKKIVGGIVDPEREKVPRRLAPIC